MLWQVAGRERALPVLLTLTLIGAPTSAPAAESPAAPEARTPKALAGWAREHSPRARALSLERAAARRSAQGAGTFMDPMVELRAAPLSVPGIVPADPHDPMAPGVEIMVAQRLPLSDRLRRERERAQALSERASHDVDAMLLDLEMEAAELACQAWATEARVRVLQQTRDVLGAMGDVMRAQIASGRASVSDAQRVDVEVAMAEVELAERAGERSAVDARTNALLGRAPDAALPPPPDAVPWLDAEPPLVDVDERAEVRAQRALLAASEAERARAADAWVPDLTATASWSSMWPLSHQFLLGVGAELPLFNDMRSAEQDSALLMVDGARAALQQTRARANAERAAVVASEQAAARALALLEEQVLPRAQARAETARAALAGGAPLDAALDATLQELDVRRQLVLATAERCMSRAQLWRAAGASFLTEPHSPESP